MYVHSIIYEINSVKTILGGVGVDTINELHITKQFVEVNDRKKELFWHILINISIPVFTIYFKRKLSVYVCINILMTATKFNSWVGS